MGYTADEFRNMANHNKSKLKNKQVEIPIGGNKYKFKIVGVGKQAIKFEKFFYYSDIIKKVQDNITDGLEYLIEQIIIDPNMEKIPNLESSSELRLRASANKQSLKRMYINACVGTKKYEFRIAGIGGKSIKLELYVGFDSIAQELNNGNYINLEFILKEILVENEIDYAPFDNIEIPNNDPMNIDVIDSSDDVSDEENKIEINKLSPEESLELISNIKGVQKLVFDAIDGIESDIFTIDDVLSQNLIKSYAVQGKSFEPVIVKNIADLIDLGIITSDDEKYYKLW